MIHAFPKKHIFAAAFIGTLLIFILALSPSSNVNAKRTPIQIDLPSTTEIEKDNQGIEPLSSAPQITAPPHTENWTAFKIKSGDTLSDLFLKAGFNDKVMYKVLFDNK